MRYVAIWLASAACAGYRLPADIESDVRALDLKRPSKTSIWTNPFDIRLDDEPFTVRHQTKKTRGWPRDLILFDQRVVVRADDQWRLSCTSKYVVQSAFRANGILAITKHSTRCSTEGGSPEIAMEMDGWPRVEGVLTIDRDEYRIRASDEHPEHPAALIVTRGSMVVLVVAEGDRIWLRTGLEDGERVALVRAGAMLWAAI